MNRRDVTDEQWEGLAQVVPLRGGDAWPSWSGQRPPPAAAPAAQGRRFVLLRPLCFADARDVADQLIGGVPILLDLTGAESDVAKRILDFASGVVFGLEAGIHRVDTNVFLLSPHGTEVDEHRRGATSQQ